MPVICLALIRTAVYIIYITVGQADFLSCKW